MYTLHGMIKTFKSEYDVASKLGSLGRLRVVVYLGISLRRAARVWG